MLSEEEKSRLKIFLINDLKWNDLNFCISDKRNLIRQLSTKILINTEISLDHLIKVREFLKCKFINLKSIDDKDHNLMIGWIYE